MARLIADIIEETVKTQAKFDETHDLESLKSCEDIYLQLLDEIPDDPQLLFQIGTVYLQRGQWGASMPWFRRALDFWPDNPHVLSNLGCAERSLHRMDQCRDFFMRSLMVEEKGETLSNLASAYVNEDLPEEGLIYAKKAMELSPDHAKVKWNAALLLLENLEYASGFKLYDAGFLCGERAFRSYSQDRPDSVDVWRGEPVDTLVVWDEQGIGDRILATNLLRNLKASGLAKKVIFECHPRLENVFRRSFPWIDHFYPTSKKETIEWPKDHTLNAKSAVMSLSQFFWPEGFDRTPYLKPDPELVSKYRKEFESYGPGPYYAFAWKGGAPKTNTKYRSVKLGSFRPLIESGGTWISLQYHEEAAGKVERFRGDTNLPVYHCAGAQERDYDHTIAAVCAADHVVTVCNSLVHTCGALGVPCSVAVPKRRAWRYPRGEHFPWYGDHIVQFHQEADGDFDSVFARIADAISDHRTRPVAAQA